MSRSTQAGLEQEVVKILLGPPPLPAYPPSLQIPSVTHDMKNLIKLESGGKHTLEEPFLVLCCKPMTMVGPWAPAKLPSTSNEKIHMTKIFRLISNAFPAQKHIIF